MATCDLGFCNFIIYFIKVFIAIIHLKLVSQVDRFIRQTSNLLLKKIHGRDANSRTRGVTASLLAREVGRAGDEAPCYFTLHLQTGTNRLRDESGSTRIK